MGSGRGGFVVSAVKSLVKIIYTIFFGNRPAGGICSKHEHVPDSEPELMASKNWLQDVDRFELRPKGSWGSPVGADKGGELHVGFLEQAEVEFSGREAGPEFYGGGSDSRLTPSKGATDVVKGGGG